MDLKPFSANISNSEGISTVKATFERYPETSGDTKVINRFQFYS